MEKESLLIKGLKELGIEPSDAVVSNFARYLFELKKWNRAYNLTALKNDEDIIIKHFLDSLLYLKAVPEGSAELCDIGSGAGFPGAPLAIVRPELHIVLIEPSRKKAAFLAHLKRELSLKNIDVINSRVEDIKDRKFDIAVTRALFSIADMIKNARHILKEKGFFILNKGPGYADELKNIPGNVTVEILPAELPCSTVQRYIIKISL